MSASKTTTFALLLSRKRSLEYFKFHFSSPQNLSFPSPPQSFWNAFTHPHPISHALQAYFSIYLNIHYSVFPVIQSSSVNITLFPANHFHPLRFISYLSYPQQYPNCQKLCWHILVVLVSKLCRTVVTSWTATQPGSSVQETFQARILEWVTISFSRRYSQPRN